MTTARIYRLDDQGAPTGEPILVEVGSVTWKPAHDPVPEDDEPIMLRRQSVSFSVRMDTTKAFTLAILGPRMALKMRRAQRHRGRIVVAPKRRRKHGRVGVYR